MKSFFACAALSLMLTAARAVEPVPPTVESLNRIVHDLTLDLDEANETIADLRQRVETLEQRMGETFRLPSPFDTVEKRLESLEKDMDHLKRP
ncbi:MAG: hypothetical protein GX548_03210 [Lentisphaerae bacterium]|nr:hypothetical protein [Lentisphaerota bacterium]